LTGDGVAAGLLVTRHAGIQGNLGFTTVRHAACLHNSAHDEFSSFMW
jgi:hypothetical protein